MKQEKLGSARMFKNSHYLLATMGLTVALYGINAMYKLLPTDNSLYKQMACSMSFVLTLTILSYIYQGWGTKRYFQAGAIALGLNVTFLFYHWNAHWGALDLFSYMALYPSFFVNWLVLSKTENTLTMPWRLFLGFVAAILLDNALLMGGLVAHFGLAKSWVKLFTSIGLKFSYSALASISVYASNKFALSTQSKAHTHSLGLDRKS